MKFNPGFVIGEVVSNREVSKAFGCGIMGGMRPSTKTGTLVLISDMTKPFYKDEWKMVYSIIPEWGNMGTRR